MRRAIISLIAVLLSVGGGAAKELFVEGTASQFVVQACREITDASEGSRQLSLKLEQLDNRLLSCNASLPPCPEIASIIDERVAHGNRERLERAKLAVFRNTVASIEVNIFPPEILLLFDKSIFSNVAAGQIAEVALAGQETLYRKEVKIAEGFPVDVIKGITLEVSKVKDSDPLGSWYRLKAIWNGGPEDYYLQDPAVAQAVAEAKTVASGRKITVTGSMKALCDLANNENGEFIRVRAAGLSTTLSGVDFRDLDLVFVITLGEAEKRYPKFDWLSSLQDVIGRLFSVSPPTRDDVVAQSSCSGSDGDTLYSVVQSMRSVIRQENLSGNPSGVLERATRRFGGGDGVRPPYLSLAIGEVGPLFGLDEKRNMTVIGYSRSKGDHLCRASEAGQ